ncbi:hypothetical protein ACWC2T_34895 [Streptomyces sp. NPDC001393]
MDQPDRFHLMDEPERFHLILTVDDQPLMHAWWEDEAIARKKFTSWKHEYSSLPGAHIVLLDREEGEPLASWPAEA